MHRPSNKPIKHNPNSVNDRAPTPMPSRIQKSTNVGGLKDGKTTNPMQIPNTQGYVGKRMTTQVKK